MLARRSKSKTVPLNSAYAKELNSPISQLYPFDGVFSSRCVKKITADPAAAKAQKPADPQKIGAMFVEKTRTAAATSKTVLYIMEI